MIDLEEEGVDDVQGGPEVEDEEATEEDLIPDLSGVQVELVDSTHEGTKWLIVNGIHICHKQKEWPEEVKWRCADWRWFKCPFSISTREANGEVEVIKMTDPEGHRCTKDKTGVMLHRFKLKLKERIQSNLDEKWSKVWSSERTKLLESVKDEPEITRQLLLEMKDSRSYRISAQRARGKMTPPIPKDHKMMDPEKVFYFFCPRLWKCSFASLAF